MTSKVWLLVKRRTCVILVAFTGPPGVWRADEGAKQKVQEESFGMNWNKKKDAPAGQEPRSAADASLDPKMKKRLKWIVPAVCVVIVAGAAWFAMSQPKAVKVSASYTQTSVERRSISESFSGFGTLQPANTYTVKSLVAGEALSADFEEGDIVEKGAVLYQVDNSTATTNIEKAQIALEQAQRNYDKIADTRYVRSDVGGTVYALKVAVGDEVTQGQEVAVIQDNSKMVLKLPFPAADAVNFQVGQSALITLDGTFETLEGRVTAISGSDVLGSGNVLIRTVTIEAINAGTMNNTQVATANINGINSIESGTFAYQAEKTLTASAAGTVSEIYVPEGSQISEDQALLVLVGENLDETIQNAAESLRSAELSRENAQEQFNNYTITSPISGTIIEKKYKQGDIIETAQVLCTIYDLSYLQMVINVDELDISNIAVGQSVNITADAINDMTYTGTVTRVSMVGTTSNGTTAYPVTIRIDETEGLRPGMNVNAEIIVAEASEAISVPNGAVQRGGYVLVTKDSPSAVNALTDRTAPDGFVYVEVTTGVSDDNYVEIVSGLQDGDKVGIETSGSLSAVGLIQGFTGGRTR